MFDVGVDDGDQIVALGYSHGSAREKVVLWIHEEEDRVSVRLGNY
jgi:hypothetical protein